ncbi:sensor c-di-GMP phosphodiesterase-like protein [Sphingomonas zeicaulis]|uniref:EAL domain-containing protein n=1 Tax=Sphingomonas zeicaulis TaxID=1632740 RepID=UPI003D1EF9DC
MRRKKILFVATVLAIGAGIAPLVVAGHMSEKRALQAEQDYLAANARWTMRRANLNLTQAEQGLRAIEQERWQDCSPAHIARMRQLAVDNPAIDEIGYYQHGRLVCTSWGTVDKLVLYGTPDQIRPGGFALFASVKPQVSGAGAMVVLSHRSHNALVARERLVDVLTNRPMTLGIATEDGRPIAAAGAVDAHTFNQIVTGVAEGADDDHLFATTHGNQLIAFAIADRASLQRRIDGERWALLPIGLLVSVVLIGLIAWVSRLRLSPYHALAIAIRKREFVANYQPIMDLSSGQCVGAEALIRWRLPDGAHVMPDVFIPLAEETGLISKLTDLMIERVVEDLSRMLNEERSVHVAINIAAEDFDSGRFLPVLAHALERSGIQPGQIWIEAVERGFINTPAARRTIEAARAAGHLVAIDDFGTGYSNLSLLEALPLDALKIDKAFIDAIGRNAATSVVTPHIIEMAHGLGITIVAEGVETPAQEAYLRAAGVQLAQGWLYSPALPADAFVSFYRQRNGGVEPAFLRSVA